MEEKQVLLVEKAVIDDAEKYLTDLYGKVRDSVDPGLRWLHGEISIPPCLDHPEYRIKDGKRTLCGRPYQLTLRDIETLIELAKKKNLHLKIEALSNYNLRALLVILTETE